MKEETKNKIQIEILKSLNVQGGLSKMWQLFGDKTEEIINELNEALAA